MWTCFLWFLMEHSFLVFLHEGAVKGGRCPGFELTRTKRVLVTNCTQAQAYVGCSLPAWAYRGFFQPCWRGCVSWVLTKQSATSATSSSLEYSTKDLIPIWVATKHASNPSDQWCPVAWHGRGGRYSQKASEVWVQPGFSTCKQL